MPKGRKEIITSWAKHDEIDSVLNQLNSEIVKGRCLCNMSLIEGEALDVQMLPLYEQLQLKFDLKVGLLHGKMTSDEKTIYESI